MTLAEMAAGVSVACFVVGLVLAARGMRRHAILPRPAASPSRSRLARWAGIGAAVRHRTIAGSGAGLVAWLVTGWPAAGLAIIAATVWLPWLLGSAAVVRQRIATLEALERWCRQMADALAGGGAIGLAQAIVTSAGRADEPIADAVAALAHKLQLDLCPVPTALTEFADAVEDRTGDAVAAALLLALDQQSTGVSAVLRQLADGVARDVRARRDIEAARAESRQSIRMLLIIQGGLLALLASVPGFSAPYATPVGQAVMALLLGGTAALLMWMRRLALGSPAPRFLGSVGDRR